MKFQLREIPGTRQSTPNNLNDSLQIACFLSQQHTRLIEFRPEVVYVIIRASCTKITVQKCDIVYFPYLTICSTFLCTQSPDLCKSVLLSREYSHNSSVSYTVINGNCFLHVMRGFSHCLQEPIKRKLVSSYAFTE